MPAIACPIPECAFVTEDVDVAVAAALLTIHNNTHTNLAAGAAPGDGRQRAPKIDRPIITKGSTEEGWNAFLARWRMFKRGTRLTPGETVQHLFQCCEEELGNNILRSHPDATRGNEDDLLAAMKRLAVAPVAISVRRSDLLTIKQDHGENVRSFYARINGKAATCAYKIDCPSTTCTQQVNFTDIIAKDVLISGLLDDEIRKDVLGWSELDAKTVKDTITFVESKETARDALSKQPTAAGISSQKSTKTRCKNCKVEIDKQIWNKRQRKMIDVTLCLPCWRKVNLNVLKANIMDPTLITKMSPLKQTPSLSPAPSTINLPSQFSWTIISSLKRGGENLSPCSTRQYDCISQLTKKTTITSTLEYRK